MTTMNKQCFGLSKNITNSTFHTVTNIYHVTEKNTPNIALHS